jgi:hypothetical protein
MEKSNTNSRQPLNLYTKVSAFYYLATMIFVQIGLKSWPLTVFSLMLVINTLGLIFAVVALKQIDKAENKKGRKTTILLIAVHALSVLMAVVYFGFITFILLALKNK